ncbi:MAG TPA: hypothetical protein PLI95_05895 [Polyangiaceae bacterium]|nr:hypothetical protein [Polyangiaceae bacterium]
MRYSNLAVALALLTLVGCGDSESDDAMSGPACESRKMTIDGEVDGTSVSGSYSTHGHSFMQGDTGSFTGSFDEDGSFSFTWKSMVAQGETTRIQGSITLPGNQGTFCVGPESRMLAGDDFWQFELVGLAKGTCPGVATSGTIRACFDGSF